MATATPKHILLRSPNWLGDAILAFPTVRALRQLYPDTPISVVARKSVADIWKSRPEISAIISSPGHHSLSSLSRWGESQKSQGFDLGILLTNSLSTALEMKYAGIPDRLGYAYGIRRYLLTHRVPPPGDIPRMVDYYLQLLKPLSEKQDFDANPDFYLSEADISEAKAILAEQGVKPEDLLIGMNPGAAYGGAKCWPSQRYMELGKQLSQSYQAKILLFGAPGDVAFLQVMADKMGSGAINMAGKTSLIQLAACIKSCRLFITNDSGPMHLAAALEVPLLALFGPTDWKSTSPVGKGVIQVLRHPVDCAPCLMRECPLSHECMIAITVDEAFKSVQSLLS